MISTAQAEILTSLEQGWTLVFWDPISPRSLFAVYHQNGARLGVSAVTGKSLRQRQLVELDDRVTREQILEWNLPDFAIPFRISAAGSRELAKTKGKWI